MKKWKFKLLKCEFASDVSAIAKSLTDFAAKWIARSDDVKDLTQEQDDEMGAIADELDKAWDAIDDIGAELCE